MFDERTWAIRALVVDTRNWWPGGKKVLVSTESIESINWGERNVRVKLTREQVKSSPTLDASERVGRDALREEERSHH